MKNIVKIALVAMAFVFAAGCAKKPAPAPEPVMTAPETGMVKHKKHHRHHYKDKLGTMSTAKDTTK